MVRGGTRGSVAAATGSRSSFVALGLLIGAILGVALDQPSAGLVIGMAIGSVIAVVVWLFDRKRST